MEKKKVAIEIFLTHCSFFSSLSLSGHALYARVWPPSPQPRDSFLSDQTWNQPFSLSSVLCQCIMQSLRGSGNFPLLHHGGSKPSHTDVPLHMQGEVIRAREGPLAQPALKWSVARVLAVMSCQLV